MKRQAWPLVAVVLVLSAVLPFYVQGAPAKKKPQAPAPAGQMELFATTTSFVVGGNVSSMRSIGSFFYSGKRAPDGATANADIPAGLGLGPSLPYTIQNQQGAAASGQGELLRYWGCGAAIGKGQPEVLKGGAHAMKGAWVGGSSGSLDPMKAAGITAASKMPGTWALHISYLGDVTVVMTEKQDFLEPLVVKEPAAPGEMDATQDVPVKWNVVSGAVGYSMVASGRNAKGQTVMWENSKNVMRTWKSMGAEKAVKAGVLIPAEHPRCTVPAGIFAGTYSLTITAYSPEVRGKGVLPSVGYAQSMASLQVGKP